MRLMSRSTLRDFWLNHKSSKDFSSLKDALTLWADFVEHANWKTSQDVKAAFRSADFVGDNRVIFDICGNKYRIVAHISYSYRNVKVKFVGTHKEYDDIDPEKV